jgi:hypothetical protein
MAEIGFWEVAEEAMALVILSGIGGGVRGFRSVL